MDISLLTINQNASIRDAIQKLEENGLGILMVNNGNNKLLGVVTDGDLRRGLLKQSSVDVSISTVMNTDFFSLPIDADNGVILKSLNDTIKVIPLIDETGKLIDYAASGKIRSIPVAAPVLTGNELEYVTECIKTGWISSQGRFVRQFEEIFSVYHENVKSVAVCNGTVALHLALVALGIKEGDEVLVPDFTFAASVNAIMYCGAVPVLADVDAITWTMDTSKLEQLITPKTKAIMPVHLYGQPCEMNEIMRIAEKHELLVVEDCAEALGSYYHNRPVGVFGDAATFSFYGNKTITTGEGGMVLFKNNHVAERAITLRDHGMDKKKRYWHQEVGYNYRMTNIQAAIGVAQFERLHEFVGAKKRIAHLYQQVLDKYDFFQCPPVNSYIVNSYWLYTFMVRPGAPFDRDTMMRYLGQHGIETRPVFYPMHVMPPYQKLPGADKLPVSAALSAAGISLPSSVSLTEVEISHICINIENFIKKYI